MSKLDLYAQDLKRRRSRTAQAGRTPGGKGKASAQAQATPAKPAAPAAGVSGAGSRFPGELVARVRRVLGEVELVEDSRVNPQLAGEVVRKGRA